MRDLFKQLVIVSFIGIMAALIILLGQHYFLSTTSVALPILLIAAVSANLYLLKVEQRTKSSATAQATTQQSEWGYSVTFGASTSHRMALVVGFVLTPTFGSASVNVISAGSIVVEAAMTGTNALSVRAQCGSNPSEACVA